MVDPGVAVESQERRLRRNLGFAGLTAIGLSNIVGFGWLFAALDTAQTAGPAALLAWVPAGVPCALLPWVQPEDQRELTERRVKVYALHWRSPTGRTSSVWSATCTC